MKKVRKTSRLNLLNFKFKEGGIVHLDDTADSTVVSNEEVEAHCTVLISLDNFDKMLAGEMNPMMAFMTGKMNLDILIDFALIYANQMYVYNKMNVASAVWFQVL